ncbi:M1 family metallopeptidase [Paraferrimonas sp. SM1919]|uniref:M1 family metallopeptidase n=1 Tax=Paraferrimonas sp. SM1919 TaxID=2662263 RepID=UPI0013D3EFD6|nr:M1 family metallopeptidase [Paraferrimonas sp. SM1919]
MFRGIVSAVAFSVAALVPCYGDEYRLERVAKPSFQAVKLDLDAESKRFSGSVSIDIEVIKPTNFIELNGLEQTITKAWLENDLGQTIVLNASQQANGIVAYNSVNEIAIGKYQMKVEFNSPYNRNSAGLYQTFDGGKGYLFTQFEMQDARRAFPVFDEPEYKIPFQLTLSAPKGQTVFSNTPVIKKTELAKRISYEFAKTKPIPSYLVAMAVGPFESVPIDGMSIPGNLITVAGKIHLADYAVKDTRAQLKLLEDYFGRPYPYAKLDSVALPEFPFGAMENAGLITYREDILLVDEANASVAQKSRSSMVIGHELAHQWYGNLVTMKWWNDLWLNEAFASWMGEKIAHKLHPEYGRDLLLSQNRVMAADAKITTKPIRKEVRNEADIMDGLGLNYAKGSAVLAMIENWIGEEPFKQGVRNYINNNEFSNAVADDLWNELAKASGKDVPAVLTSFIEQSSYPLISFSREGNKLTLSQQRFVNAGVKAKAQTWTVPVALKLGKGDKVWQQMVLLDSPSKTISLDGEPDWVYPDANAFGYYRWLLNEELQASLLANSEQLNTRERLAFIAATGALLKAGKINAGQYQQAIERFVNDAHPKVISEALTALTLYQQTFVNSNNLGQWRAKLANTLKPVLAQIGEQPKKAESNQIPGLRSKIIYNLGAVTEDAEVISLAQALTKSYLNDFNSIDAATAGSYLLIAAHNGDKALLDSMIAKFKGSVDPANRSRLLAAIFSFSDNVGKQAFDFMFDESVTSSDMRSVLYYVTSVPGQEQRGIDYIFANFDKVLAKVPPYVQPSLPGYMLQCKQADFDRVQGFFKPKIDEQPGYQRTLTKLQESVQDCATMHSAGQASFDAWLK